jgi:catechol 2,3-dioxygenase-like lactoylglutathione lyase family enzyme
MHEIADRLIREVESGRLSRREAVGRLVAVAAVAFGTPSGAAESTAGEEPTYRSVGLNHIALRVTDIPRSREFYQKHLGLKPLQESQHNCFLGAGRNNFVALFRAEQPGLDHYCYTIDDYRAGDVVQTLETAGLNPRRTQNRVYFDDPDGIEVQLAGEWGDDSGDG